VGFLRGGKLVEGGLVRLAPPPRENGGRDSVDDNILMEGEAAASGRRLGDEGSKGEGVGFLKGDCGESLLSSFFGVVVSVALVSGVSVVWSDGSAF